MKSPIVVTSENFVKEDKFNNKIFLRIFYNEQKEKLSGNIHLNLVKEKRNRFIGTYHYPEKTLYVKRSSKKHLFRKSKS